MPDILLQKRIQPLKLSQRQVSCPWSTTTNVLWRASRRSSPRFNPIPASKVSKVPGPIGKRHLKKNIPGLISSCKVFFSITINRKTSYESPRKLFPRTASSATRASRTEGTCADRNIPRARTLPLARARSSARRRADSAD